MLTYRLYFSKNLGSGLRFNQSPRQEVFLQKQGRIVHRSGIENIKKGQYKKK